jgi:methylase of polypeptide subunit release factors
MDGYTVVDIGRGSGAQAKAVLRMRFRLFES